MNNKAWVRLKFFSVLCCTIFFLSPVLLKGQGTVRLRVISGGNVSFIFNSLSKYQSGIIYLDWSKLSVFIKNKYDWQPDGTDDDLVSWSLNVKVTSVEFICDDGVALQHLDLPTLKLVATTTGTGGTPQDITLTNSPQAIVEDLTSPFATDIIGDVTISYYCGTNAPNPVTTTVFGEKSGYYYIDLEFSLEAIY